MFSWLRSLAEFIYGSLTSERRFKRWQNEQEPWWRD